MQIKKKYKGHEEKNEDDFDFYSKDVREIMVEDDELSPIEEAFMEGYDTA